MQGSGVTGDSPALPGRQPQLDSYGGIERRLPFVIRQSITKGSQVLSYQSLQHTKWECRSHIVLIPKCLRKVL